MTLETCIASIAQLAEHALRKRTVVGSIPIGCSFNSMGVSFLLLCSIKGSGAFGEPAKK